MILILTAHAEDPTVVSLAATLDKRGADVVVLGAAALAEAHLDLGPGTPLTITLPDGRSFTVDEIDAAFLWRLSVPLLNDPVLDPVRDDDDALRFVVAQWTRASRSLFHALEQAGVPCVNPATAATMWEDKISQLMAATEVGLTVPPTRYTCDLGAAADFADEVGGGRVAFKPFGPYLGQNRVEGHITQLYCQVLPAAELRHQAGDDLVPTPAIWQPYVPKAHELRVVYVGGTIFSCRIESQASEVANEDWRRYDIDNTPHLPHELDPGVAARVHALMARMGLVFGSLDFIVTPEGEHVFLEINPVGQFDWIAELTGHPIYERLAELLIEGA